MTSQKAARSALAAQCEDAVPISSLFSIDMAPYKPPRSKLGALLWRKRIWFETTFGASVLEPWEKTLFCALVTGVSIVASHDLLLTVLDTVLALVSTLFWAWVYKYLPHQLMSMALRARYYVSGE